MRGRIAKQWKLLSGYGIQQCDVYNTATITKTAFNNINTIVRKRKSKDVGTAIVGDGPGSPESTIYTVPVFGWVRMGSGEWVDWRSAGKTTQTRAPPSD